MTARANLELKAGETFSVAMTWSNPPTTITNFTFALQVRPRTVTGRGDRWTYGAPLVDATTANGLLVLDAATSTVTLSLPATATAGLLGTLYYDLRAVRADNPGEAYFLLEGTLTAHESVTR
jgi:hypothetical protein